ncbi:ferritin-like domain-containing protein [Aquabacterium sp. A08]|uniref:ferritin-like domain-containing protein n=1 Tax=Aquabacterium sp. A08 TaxID=2718532 RepID=UPI00141E5009|nr:ferritin-like domain-containing protein [Aquabacterium sp. A08]NIC40597.1 ferritin-like domain-containing protein [Aquabacterium sp. A08]
MHAPFDPAPVFAPARTPDATGSHTPGAGHPTQELRRTALAALACADVTDKCAQVQALFAEAEHRPLDAASDLAAEPALAAWRAALPGRPASPRLIAPAQVPPRSPFTPDGAAALVHAICHIEFNAINLALDAVWRFADMPRDFYLDWLRVAAEEALHFQLLHTHLQGLPRPGAAQPGWRYGDFDAHDGLWAMCEKTAHDRTARMALVPRTLEARGLDATPLIQAKLRKVGSADALRAVDILDVILRDEVGHVAIGNHWYRWLCERQGLEPVAHYRLLARRHSAPRLKPPFNDEARRRAGFTQAELDFLLGA